MSSDQLTQFSQEIGGWANFYVLFGTAAVTLVGLLFVAISVNIDTIANPRHRDLRALALNTFVSFLFLLVIACIFLLPRSTPQRLAWFIIVANLSSMGRVLVQGLVAYRTEDRTVDTLRIVFRFILPGIFYAAVVPFAIAVSNGDDDGLLWLAFLALIQLGLAVASVWDLLLIVGRDKREGGNSKGTAMR